MTLALVLGSLCLLKHPDKTFIGRIERGFDFLGYHFGTDGISVAKKTVENFVARAIWLYEQERREPFGSPRFGSYVRRWIGWAAAGFEGQRTSQLVKRSLVEREFEREIRDKDFDLAMPHSLIKY